MDWSYIILLGLLLVIFGYAIWHERANAKEWLKWAVAEAEKALGSGTGQLKLHMVYDMFVEQFSWVSTFVSFDTFSIWVDEALVWLNKQLSENVNVRGIINDSTTDHK